MLMFYSGLRTRKAESNYRRAKGEVVKRKTKRLKLHRETLRDLKLGSLREVAGGTGAQFTCVEACTQRPVSLCICP